jgi:hypothetical protein
LAPNTIRSNIPNNLLERLPMKTLVVSTAMIALLLPTTVLAEDLSFGGGVTVTSNSLSDGLSETGNSPAIQPYFELNKNGFYAGVWATNLKDDVGNRAELDLFLGYRGETAAGIGYDLGYTQHFYDKTHAASSELAVSLGVPVTTNCPSRARCPTIWPKRPLARVWARNSCWPMLGPCTPTSVAPILPQA